ncbi:SLOG family protein [Hymenobacter aerophilus]|uniref:SLOG family protein n=1 Tax=Hymenobacter aerophilus TaxID=119644 RepID=UPI000360B2A2|nr:SLOG family protein [Hymenobacter aerophilus]
MIKTQYTVGVTGSRSLQACAPLLARLEQLQAAGQLGRVVCGGAAGVDSLAADWCRAHGVPLLELRPDYANHGPAAPHVRNAEIVRGADLVLVCWDGQSRGTLSAARAATRLGRRCEWLAHPAPGAVPVAGGLGL